MGMDVYGINPTTEAGKYFRASVWSWRPIHAICSPHCDTTGWEYNDGHGLDSQEECDRLADALDSYLAENPHEKFVVNEERDLKATRDGRLVSGDEALKAMCEGNVLESPWQASRGRLREWVAFLRGCGGFKIH